MQVFQLGPEKKRGESSGKQFSSTINVTRWGGERLLVAVAPAVGVVAPPAGIPFEGEDSCFGERVGDLSSARLSGTIGKQ